MAGALPLMLGAPEAGFTNALFESVSGMTTTGRRSSWALTHCRWARTCGGPCCNGWGPGHPAGGHDLPAHHEGGRDAVLPQRGVRHAGKILPRAFDISIALIQVYLVLTVALHRQLPDLRDDGVRRHHLRAVGHLDRGLRAQGCLVHPLSGGAGAGGGGVHDHGQPALHPLRTGGAGAGRAAVARHAGARLSALDRIRHGCGHRIRGAGAGRAGVADGARGAVQRVSTFSGTGSPVPTCFCGGRSPSWC